VVVVGATVVLVVAWPEAVDSFDWPPHPLISRTSRTGTARRATERQWLAGMRMLPPARHRGEGRVSRDVMEIGELTSNQSGGDGAAATATSFDDAPCPTGRGRGSLASRSTVLTANTTRRLASRREHDKRGRCHSFIAELR
jgi:hypothetical protein